MKTLAMKASVAIAIATMLLTGCGGGSVTTPDPGPTTPEVTAQSEGYEPSSHGVYYEKLPDGYDLMCVYARAGSSGGVSCDWEGHKTWLEKK
ncbi:MAG: hypothetical protein ABIP74_05065 [Candidatus Saccharimonas sp.]